MKRGMLFFLTLWGFWTSLAHAQWQQVSSPADRVWAFIQSDAGIFAGSENSSLWKSANGGASFAIHPTALPEMNFDIRSFDLNNDTLWAALYGGGICRSIDGGLTWSSFNDGFETQALAIGVKQINDTVYAAIDFLDGLQPSGVYKTSVQQANWKRAGSGYPTALYNTSSFTVTASGAMFVSAGLAGSRGNVQVSVDNAKTWLNRNIARVSDVVTLEAKGDTVYAGTSSGFFVTKNFGETWERLGTDFQTNTVDDLMFFGSALYAAVDQVGVAYSMNNGASWNIITGNLPIDNDYVSRLFIYNGKLFAALSSAHGVWRMALPTTGVDENEPLPCAARLEQNYPNPFNPSTKISFSLPKTELVTLKVYDVIGREVATILNKERREAGSSSVTFEAAHLASGIYFYHLTAGNFAETKKMLLVK